MYEAFKDEKDWKQVARTLGVNTRSAYEWLKNQQGFPKKKGGSPSTKTPEILAAMEENSSITLY